MNLLGVMEAALLAAIRETERSDATRIVRWWPREDGISVDYEYPEHYTLGGREAVWQFDGGTWELLRFLNRYNLD